MAAIAAIVETPTGRGRRLMCLLSKVGNCSHCRECNRRTGHEMASRREGYPVVILERQRHEMHRG